VGSGVTVGGRLSKCLVRRVTRTRLEYVHGREDEDEDGWPRTGEGGRGTSTQPAAGGGRWVGVDRSLLDFERLDVYRCAIEFLGLAVRITAHMPRGHSDLRDQLRRASTSIPLNIAEASGKTGGADRARFHAIARGSALECAAILDVLHLLHAVSARDADQGRLLLSRVVAMLTRMCR
jgi:four helix bundle protein